MNWYSHHIFLILGLIFISAAVASAWAGKTRARWSGWVYRTKEPRAFWSIVAAYSVCGLVCLYIHWLTSSPPQ